MPWRRIRSALLSPLLKVDAEGVGEIPLNGLLMGVEVEVQGIQEGK